MRVGSTSRPKLVAPSGRGRQTWSPPYSLPAAGQVVSISTNFASDVKPGTHTGSQWNNALFGYYGGGALVEEYSRAGGYVIAGSGGHAVPPNLGACIFDFEDATWKRLDNANGVANQNTDFLAAEIDATFGEIIAATTPGIPAPAHLYAHVFQLKSSQGGGSRGSFMRVRGASAAVDSTRGSGYAHRIDLSTGLWSRVTTNATAAPTGRVTVYDPVTRRYITVLQQLHSGNPLNYIDEADWTWKTDGFTNPGDLGNSFGAFADLKRRLLVVATTNEALHAFDLDNINVLTTLTLSGSIANDTEQYAWTLYPPDGCYYKFAGSTTTTAIEKLTPPASSPLTNAWTVSTVNVGTALTQQPAAYLAAGSIHHTRFFYVPALGCLAWIPGGDEPVVLLRPPN